MTNQSFPGLRARVGCMTLHNERTRILGPGAYRWLWVNTVTDCHRLQLTNALRQPLPQVRSGSFIEPLSVEMEERATSVWPVRSQTSSTRSVGYYFMCHERIELIEGQPSRSGPGNGSTLLWFRGQEPRGTAPRSPRPCRH